MVARGTCLKLDTALPWTLAHMMTCDSSRFWRSQISRGSYLAIYSLSKLSYVKYSQIFLTLLPEPGATIYPKDTDGLILPGVHMIDVCFCQDYRQNGGFCMSALYSTGSYTKSKESETDPIVMLTVDPRPQIPDVRLAR